MHEVALRAVVEGHQVLVRELVWSKRFKEEGYGEGEGLMCLLTFLSWQRRSMELSRTGLRKMRFWGCKL